MNCKKALVVLLVYSLFAGTIKDLGEKKKIMIHMKKQRETNFVNSGAIKLLEPFKVREKRLNESLGSGDSF